MIALPLPFPEMPAAPTRPAPTPAPARESTRSAPAPGQRHEIAREPAANPPARRRALWLGVHLLNWPLHAALSSLNESDRQALSSKPLAIVDSDRRNTLAACNDAALSVGVRPGHSMNAAIALCADLQFLPRHADRELTRLDEIAALCQRYTSAVTVQPPNELLLEVRGSLRLFGGIHTLMSRVQTDLLTQGLRTQLALSATAQSAQWLARTAREPVAIPPRQLLASLSAQPIAALMWPGDIELRLRRFGVVTIGDLLRLPGWRSAWRMGGY
jgi:protein ImuB